MLSTPKIIAIGVMLAVAGSGIALAETMPEHHAVEPEYTQNMAGSAQHPTGPGNMPD
jgi:hypothetical protein